MPHFPGCEVVEGEEAKRQCSKEKLREFIQQNLEYPKEARRNNISGKVLIQFIVQPDGRSTGIEVLEGLGYGCNEEAIRVLKLLEEQHIWWSPRGSRGRPIRILYKVPVQFKLLY